MQARVDWVLKIFGTQVTKQKRPVRPVFSDYLSVSYDYAQNELQCHVCVKLLDKFKESCCDKMKTSSLHK